VCFSKVCLLSLAKLSLRAWFCLGRLVCSEMGMLALFSLAKLCLASVRWVLVRLDKASVL